MRNEVHEDKIGILNRGPRGSSINYDISRMVSEGQHNKRLARLGAVLK